MGLFVELVMEVVLARQSLRSPQCGGVLNVVVVVVNLFIQLESHRKTGVFLDRITDITFTVNLKGRLDQNS